MKKNNLPLIFATFLLITGLNLSLSAQKPLVFNDIKPLLAELISDLQYGIILSPDVTSSVPDLYYESELRLEPWMFASPSWIQKKRTTKPDRIVEGNIESDLQLEDWMLQPFGPSHLLPEKEEELRLEDWMMKPEEWGRE